MKATGILVALAAFVLTSGSAYSAESYIRPELLWSKGKLENIKSNKFGAGVVGGTTLGAQSEHDIGISISQTKFTDQYAYQVIMSPAKTTGVMEFNLKATPVMLNYRYRFMEKGARIRPYVGPSIGLLNAKVEMKANAVATNVTTGAFLSSISSSESKSTTAFNWGATAGLIWNINDKFALDLGYRYSQAKIKISEWEMNNNFKVSTLALGANFSF